MNPKTNYADEIKKLNNPTQEEAILYLDNCTLLACPGAGKTKTVILKAAYLLKEIIKEPRGLACITFSNNAAKEFRDRFENLNINKSTHIFFGTVHSFCLSELVLPFGNVFLPDLINDKTEIADDEHRLECMQKSLEKHKINERPNQWFFQVNNIRRVLHNNPEIIKSKRNKIIDVCIDYEKELRKQNLIDFEDIIFISLDLIKGYGAVRKAICSKYPWIIIDEYQDLGESLHQIIIILLETGGIKIFAVGDPHQSIHGFAGADPKHLLELCNRKDVRCFDTVYNYRCCQPIIDASIEVLKPTEIKKYLSKKEDPNDGNIFFQECKSGPDEQIELIVKNIIPKLLERQIKFGDVAILIRNWLDIYYFEKRLNEASIPTIIVKDVNYDLTPLTLWVEDLAKWCAGGWKNATPSFNDLFIFWLDYTEIVDKKVKQPLCLQEKKNFFRKLQILKQKDYILKEWLSQFIGLFEIDRIFSLSKDLSSNTIREIKSFNEMIKMVSETDFGNQKISQFKGMDLSKDKIILMSLHSSKGLQFDSVIMPMLEEGVIPSWDEKNIPEARRLFYVGITRAQSEVYLLWSGFNKNKYGRRFDNGPSRFVLELIKNQKCNSLFPIVK